MPIPGNPDTRLPTLRACLKAVRVRTRIKSMLRGAVFSLVAALALLCGLEISGLYFEMATPAGSLALLSEHPLSCLAFGAAALACAFALATFLAFFRTPDAAVLARKADRALALQERLSTALEVDKSLPPDAVLGPVPSALLADAERHAAMIDPRQIVRLDLPRAIWAVPGLIAAALLIQLVPPDALAVARGSIAGAERDQAGFTGQQGAEAAANLRRIAELLGKDAQERSDPYLRTIARTLERLSADAERPSVDRHTLGGPMGRQPTRPANRPRAMWCNNSRRRWTTSPATAKRERRRRPRQAVATAPATSRRRSEARRVGRLNRRSARRPASERRCRRRCWAGSRLWTIFSRTLTITILSTRESRKSALSPISNGAPEQQANRSALPRMPGKETATVPVMARVRSEMAPPPQRPNSHPALRCCCPIRLPPMAAVSASSFRRRWRGPQLRPRRRGPAANGSEPGSRRSRAQCPARRIARLSGATSCVLPKAAVHEPDCTGLVVACCFRDTRAHSSRPATPDL